MFTSISLPLQFLLSFVQFPFSDVLLRMYLQCHTAAPVRIFATPGSVLFDHRHKREPKQHLKPYSSVTVVDVVVAAIVGS